MGPTVVRNATCVGCGCVCDDIDLHTDGATIVRADRACDLGRAYFSAHPAGRVHPDALLGGRPAAREDAIAAAARILRGADFPLVFGLGQSTVEAVREAVHLAEVSGGVIDTHTSLTHGPTKTAAQLVGKVACTLGEVRNRADLIVYWGSNPAESHPRHLSRYTLDPPGKFTPRGRADRTVVVVDVRETATGAAADVFLRINPGADFEVVTALRAMLRGQRVDAGLVAAAGLEPDRLRELVGRMKAARFGVLFFGSGLAGTRGRHMNAAAVLTLAAELNGHTKFTAVPMRDHGNEAGADHVLTWLTGYPLGVDFTRGYPRSNPGEFTAADLLARREADAAVVIGDGPWAMLPQPALDHLARIPSVVINAEVGDASRAARVHLTAAATGVGAAGTVYRMDKIPLPVRAVLPTPYPSEEELIRRVREAVGRAGLYSSRSA